MLSILVKLDSCSSFLHRDKHVVMEAASHLRYKSGLRRDEAVQLSGFTSVLEDTERRELGKYIKDF